MRPQEHSFSPPRMCARWIVALPGRSARSAEARSKTSIVFAIVFFSGLSIFAGAATGDNAEHRDREITVRFQEPDEIEAVKDLIKTGDLDHAQNRASAIETPRYRIISLGYVAEAFAKRGEIDEAEAVGLNLAIGAQRDWVLVYVVMGAVSHSAEVEIFDELISAISGATARTRALCFVALGQLVRGQLADAEHTAVRAASEAAQIIAPNDVAEMNGWIATLSSELGRPPGLGETLDNQFWFGIPNPAYFIAATSSAEMLDMIGRARASLKTGSTLK